MQRRRSRTEWSAHTVTRNPSAPMVEALEPRALLAGDWATVDDYQLVPGRATGFRDMTADTAGNLYAVGEAFDATGAIFGVVREKHVGTDQWITTSTLPGVSFSLAAADAAGNLYVDAQNEGNSWLILERPAGATDFVEVDRMSGNLKGLAVGAAGDVYAVGEVFDGGFWVVRKRSGGQGTFATVDDYSDPGAFRSTAQGVHVVAAGPAAGVYVVGTVRYSSEATGNSLVRKSTDGGASWSVVDEFDFAADGNDGPGGSLGNVITSDAAGNLYYAGRGIIAATVDGSWFVRRSPDGGATWSTAGMFTVPSLGTWPNDIGTDAAGNVYLVGYKFDGGAQHAIVVDNTGGSLHKSDDFAPAPGYAEATGFAAGADGKIYVAGSAYEGTSMHGFVRAAPAPAPAPAGSVVGRHVFYNRSTFDGNDGAGGPADDAAIAPDKAALLPGQVATFANVTSYSRGINGIMVDFAGLPEGVTLTRDDFEFRSGAELSKLSSGPNDAQVSVRRGAGVNGSDRVTLTWPNYIPNVESLVPMAVAKNWLEVTVKADANTGLALSDVFYFGNLIGDTGGADTAFRVNALDLGAVKRELNGTATPSSKTDINRDGRVNALDLGLVKQNLNRALSLLAVPIPAAPGVAFALSALFARDAAARRQAADELLA